MSLYTTIGGWTLIGGLIVYYFVRGQRKQKNLRVVPSKQAVKQAAKVEPKKDGKAKKTRKESGQSSGDQSNKAGPQKAPKKKTQQVIKAEREEQAFTTGRADEADDATEEINNREFARQLQNAKAGTVIASKSQAAGRPKSVKQTRAQEKPVAETSSDNATAPSSTTGGDADDDESPLNSPELAATAVDGPVGSSDISDMLEKPAAGPSVLKINAPTNPVPVKKAKAQAAPAVVEGKQQKKNKKKAEQAKAAKEQAEAERKEKLEKQLKTARIAEGRAAKDGSSFMAAQAPSSTAWTGPAAKANGDKNGANTSNVELLDTYESSSSNAAATVPEGVYSQSQVHGTGILTEEEALAVAMKESENWEVVKTKEKKTRAKKAASPETKATKEAAAVASDEGGTDYGVPPVTAPTQGGQKWEMETAHVDDDGKIAHKKQVVQDSEWVVA